MTRYRKQAKKVARIRIAGRDKKGIIATITSYLYENGCNIEDIDQRILEGYLIMNMLVDFSALKTGLSRFLSGLDLVGREIGVETTFKPEEKKNIKNVALLVTKESHCLTYLLDQFKAKKLQGRPVVVIGNQSELKDVARRYGIPFYYVASEKKRQHEEEVLTLIKKFDCDLIVLARYMQILSPEFIFRHEGKIINIHPSLLPAFPGPRSYHQAFNKGVEVVGVTAHFVTTDLDEGPIIAQDCFKVDKTCDTVDTLLQRGRQLEAKVLGRAVKLFLEDRLVLRRGKVLDSKKDYCLTQTTKNFYQ